MNVGSLTSREPVLAELGRGGPSADRLVDETISDWRSGSPANTIAFLQDHDEIQWRKSQILDLAYEEFCLNIDGSDTTAIDEFLDRFSFLRHSLRRQIEVHQYLVDSTEAIASGDDALWPVVGDRVLDFMLVEELGRGSFARVFLCTQSGLGERTVVVKFAYGGGYEADLMGRLSHPNIMPLHSVQNVDEKGLSAICMPYCGRSTLCDLIDIAFQNGTLPDEADVVFTAAKRWLGTSDTNLGAEMPSKSRGRYVESVIRIGIELASALDHAHQRGVIHGDLKPSNVLLTPAGKAIVLDFNLASEKSLAVYALGGTLPYMAPEQIASVMELSDGVAYTADERSDVFSLGVVLYEVLCGSLPYELPKHHVALEDTGKAILERHRESLSPIRSRNPHVDDELGRTIERCLAYDRRERPASMQELAADLRRCLSTKRRVFRWLSYHKVLAATFLFVLLVSCMGTLWYFVTRPPFETRVFESALAQFRANQPKEAMHLLTEGLREEPRSSRLHYLRGHVLLKQKMYRDAHEEFRAAYESENDSLYVAGQAYCLAKMSFFRESSVLYQQALETNQDTVEVRNNLAYCLLQRHKPAKAREHLEAAVAKSDSNYQVYLNWVMLELQQARESPDYVPERGLEYASRLTRMVPEHRQVRWLVVRLFALAAHRNDMYSERALDSFELACAHGLPFPKIHIRRDPAFAALVGQPRFQRALDSATAVKQSSPPDRLIEPALAL